MKEKKIIDVKEAYSFAIKYFRELVGDYECILEEVEMSSNSQYWLVTLSYYVERPRSGSPANIKVVKKSAKKFGIDSHNGTFFSMKNASLYD